MSHLNHSFYPLYIHTVLLANFVLHQPLYSFAAAKGKKRKKRTPIRYLWQEL